MFTGIIEEIGMVQEIRRTNDTFSLSISAKKIMNDIHLGDSIAVNGVCLTVTSFTAKSFSVDVMPETLKATSLCSIKRGSSVNLERAMSAAGRFGGHFVSGHVDGTGVIRRKTKVANAVYYEIEAPDEIMSYILFRGSIAIDGTSLTIFSVDNNSFNLSIIPHTLSETVLGNKSVGDIVNIECDMLGKYVHHFLNKRTESNGERRLSLTARFLEENGFK